MYLLIGVFLFMKKIKFGFFIKDSNFEKFPKIHFLSILEPKKGGRWGVKIAFFSHFDPKYICVPKMKFLGLKMKKLLFAGYTLPLISMVF